MVPIHTFNLCINIPKVILGGGGIGAGVGLVTHWVKSLSGNRPPVSEAAHKSQ